MQVIFKHRDFSVMYNQPITAGWSFDRLSWTDRGGPLEAELSATGDWRHLGQLVAMLRCPVDIYDGSNEWCWGGYIEAVTLNRGSLSIGFSLENFSNKVTVQYNLIVGSTSTPTETAVVSDAVSIAEYGIRQFRGSGGDSTAAAAAQVTAALLEKRKYPQGVLMAGMEQGDSVTISCRGWFDILEWQYAVTTDATVNSVTQIITMVTTYGQFITSTILEPYNLTGLNVPQLRLGDQTAFSEVGRMMDVGGPNSRRLIGMVDEQRRLILSEEPANDAATNYSIDHKGMVFTNKGAILRPDGSWRMVGNWIRITDMIPGTADVTYLLGAQQQYCEGGELSGGVFTPQFRGGLNDNVLGVIG